MKNRFFFISAILTIALCCASSAFAQNCILNLRLVDGKTGEPVEYATVSLTKAGSTDVFKYAQTGADGKISISGLPAGKFTVKGIMLGYETYEKAIELPKDADLGTCRMKVQAEFLEGAMVTDVGNPIVVKKDTIEHNVALLKTSDNDVLEDLLKRLPGVEVDSDGKITANGKEINKIYVDGKQFFLDDPSIASKNLPAKIVDKVRVVEKKSEQAEFTGIDDGEEETVLDLGIKKGMMNGWFGNVLGGGGTDLHGKDADGQKIDNDVRYQGAAMVARFSQADQIAFIGNANNTNNRGFNDLAANAMGDMGGGGRRGFGGGNNGISTSYMAGVNGGHQFDDKSEIFGNGMYNNNTRLIEEKTATTTLKKDGSSLFATEDGITERNTQGVRAAARADWKISKTTSLLFEPNFNLGWGRVDDYGLFTTDKTSAEGVCSKVNEGFSSNTSDSRNQNASARLLWRQRLGKPGRTLSVNARYQFANTDMTGYNYSETNTYTDDGLPVPPEITDQYYERNSKSNTVSGRLSYTEPLGGNFYLEGNYSINYKNSTSFKDTYNKDAAGNYTDKDDIYSSEIVNKYTRQDAGINFRKQEEKYNITIGANFQPTRTENHTISGGARRDTVIKVFNWAPNARVDFNFSDYRMLRLNYRGSSTQPSINQLMPVPDNTNPQKITLGNLGLKPSFSHSLRMMYRSTNMENYASFNAHISFNYNTRNIVNASWNDAAGVQYTVPVNNDRGSYSANAFVMFNSPIAKSKFSIMSFTNAGLSTGVSLVGDDSKIDSSDESSYLNMANYTQNDYHRVSASENLRFVFRGDIVETSLGGNVRYSQTWYSISEKNVAATWTNSVEARFIAKIPDVLDISTDARYNFYKGYESGYNDPTLVWNAEISKQIFKKAFTLSLKAYDILNQSKNTYRTQQDNYVRDVRNNTLGRYVVLSLTYRFGTFAGNRRGPQGGPMGGGPMRGGHRRF